MAADKWYESPSGVVIRRYRSDDAAASDIAAALDRGWTVLSHNVVASPSLGFWFVFLFFWRQTEHVITVVKAA